MSHATPLLLSAAIDPYVCTPLSDPYHVIFTLFYFSIDGLDVEIHTTVSHSKKKEYSEGNVGELGEFMTIESRS